MELALPENDHERREHHLQTTERKPDDEIGLVVAHAPNAVDLPPSIFVFPRRIPCTIAIAAAMASMAHEVGPLIPSKAAMVAIPMTRGTDKSFLAVTGLLFLPPPSTRKRYTTYAASASRTCYGCAWDMRSFTMCPLLVEYPTLVGLIVEER